MKYTCEVCGAMFAEVAKCTEHERECRDKYETALFLAEDITFMPDRAKRGNFGLCVKVKFQENDFKFFNVINAEYVHKDNRVVINIDQNEQQQKQDIKKPTKKL